MFGRRHFGGHHARFFEKGDLKYVILDLIKDKPAHGYEIIRALEERFHGFYSPSAGSIYPTLQLLEDMEYVSSSEQDGKKVYTVSDKGRQFLRERGETMDKIKAHMRDCWGASSHEEIREIMHQMGYLARSVAKNVRSMDKEKLSRLREIISRAQHDMEAIA